jgi:hypothetical protein
VYAGLGEDLQKVVEVVTGYRLLQLRVDLLGVGAVRLDELLLLVLGLDVGLAFVPEKETQTFEKEPEQGILTKGEGSVQLTSWY